MATLEGTIRRDGRGAANLRVVGREVTRRSAGAGTAAAREALPSVRTVGEEVTDEQGRFRLEFDVPEDTAGDGAQAQVGVEVFDGPTALWESPAAPVADLIRIDHDLAADVEAASTGGIRGRITECGRPAAGLEVVAFETTQIGFQLDGGPCRPATNRRTVGSTTTRSDGRFTIPFSPTGEPPGACTFSASCHVEVSEGGTRRWTSPQRPSRTNVRFDHEFEPGCGEDATRIEVVDQRTDRIPNAEVFVNGRLRGTTNHAGRLIVEPALEVGDELVARQLVHQQPTPRRSHDQDSQENWCYRVYQTSLSMVYDRDTGNDIRFLTREVQDPDDMQTLRLSLVNVLVGFNLMAAVEWNATRDELREYLDRLTDMSELLFNATDGQFVVERISVRDTDAFWDEADIRIYAASDQSSHASIAGIFGDSGWIHMNPNDARYSGTLLHELGHYALAVYDEYKHGPDSDTDEPPHCTRRAEEDDEPFKDGGRKDSCMMRGNRFKNRKKICSGHSQNPHNPNNRQGEEPCWTEILRRYTHRPVHLRSPEDRRAPVLDQLPEAPIPTLGTTPPASGMLEVSSFIPLHDWKAKWHMRVIPDAARRELDDAGAEHPGRCAGLLVARVLLDGEPVDGARVWLRSGGRDIFQGRARRAELPSGARTDAGEVPVRGACVGDELRAVLEDAGDGQSAEGSATVTSRDDRPVIELTRRPGRPRLDLEPGEPGRLRIAASTTSRFTAVPQLHVEVDGATPRVLRVAAVTDREARRGSGELAGLPLRGRATVQAATDDEAGEATRRADVAFASTLVSERLLLHSTDGRIELLLDEGAVEGPTQVLAQEVDRLPGAVDGELLSGPYRLARWPDEPLRRPGVVTFEVPLAEEAAVRDRLDRIAVLRWDGQGWQRLPTTVSVERVAASAKAEQLGIYALALVS